MEPWPDYAPCRLPSDRAAGNRPANPIFIRQPVRGLLNSRRTDRRGFPAASDPPRTPTHPCRWIASELPEAHLPDIRPDHRASGSILYRYSAVTTCLGGFGLSQQ